jgi:hypothetical protein
MGSKMNRDKRNVRSQFMKKSARRHSRKPTRNHTRKLFELLL